MRESFLHFVWKFQHFDKTNLVSTENEAVKVYSIGSYNTNAGPDFLNAKVKIHDMLWHGHVEIHTSSSYWYKHGHHSDRAYDNVVLHVVWDNDRIIKNKEGKIIPTIELKNRVSRDLVLKCNQLLSSPEDVPCASQMKQANKMNVLSMLQQGAIERLKNKSLLVFELLRGNKMDWEESAYQLLAKNFGFKINGDTFLSLAQKIPFKTIRKHSGNLFQIEALLFGAAGFLHGEPKDDYHAKLMNEYVFLSKKYGLEGYELHQAMWKHLRLRPGNFPAVRIAQLAALLNRSPHLFDSLIRIEDSRALRRFFKVKTSDYWKQHYNFGRPSAKQLTGMGNNSIDSLIINTTAPLLTAYGQHTDDNSHLGRALSILEEIKPEQNKIIEKWQAMNISCANAFESQAMIELYHNYCLKKRCLSCKIGAGLIGGR